MAVLLVSAGLEGLSWRTAHQQLRAEASAHHLDLGEHVATASDPMPTTVFLLEDSAALVGLALALAALLLHLVTGSAVWDAVASLLIGLLLTAVYIGPRDLLVLAHVVPVPGADLLAGVGRLRRRLLALPAVTAVEVTPVERAS